MVSKKIFCQKGTKAKANEDRHVSAHNAEHNSIYCSNFIKTSKYNIVTFLPLNLFEQFRKAANLYFLFQIIIMSIPKITALNPASTAVPLALVLLATMIKDGFDDYGRHKSDSQINNKIANVLEPDGLKKKKWQDISTGDIIKVEDDESIPADVLLISTQNPSGLCFIETADLDGETNLKVRQPLSETNELFVNDVAIQSFNGEVKCEPPNNRLERFTGNLIWNGVTYSLDNGNVVLRGCVLRNTPWIYGIVLYAGHDSKLMMNSGKTVFKRTKLDRMTNLLVIWIALLLALICSFCSLMSYFMEKKIGKNFQTFLPWEEFYKNSPALIALINWPGFVMVLNTLIPISLYISVELIRLGQSLLISNDIELYDEGTDTPAIARNTTLTEELGQIEYIFSDKTGTLTQNIMEFKECSINGKMYGHVENSNGSSLDKVDGIDFSFNKYADLSFQFYDQSLIDEIKKKDEHCMEFFRVLALCHTVMVEEKIEEKDPPKNGFDVTDFVPCQRSPAIEYQAQSPDEGALVAASRNFGFIFKSRTPNSILIETPAGEETYELICILDFDNVRKRMSVIVRKNNIITLYCKGADTVLYELLSRESEPIKSPTLEQLDVFASEGLRTLVLAFRILTEEELTEWQALYKKASTAMEAREEKLMQAFEMIEKNLTLIGATAIEDKLQDHVPETIANLAEANIKIWVLTGDKQETAINIGYSSMLLTDNLIDVFIINTEENEIDKQMKGFLEKINEFSTLNHNDIKSPKVGIIADHDDHYVQEMTEENCEKEGFGLVISGKYLAYALLPKHEMTFLELAKLCKAVICCRVTPLQKALVVELVKKNVKATTLAIGDGANDVSMIKAAHIGVGISGKEGRQAVLAADYSFAQFRFLERLLMVHGRWSYWRMSKFLGYFFYKNFAFTLVQFWYSFFNGFTAMTLYDTWFLSVYNVCFTSLPVLALGIFDQDVSAASSLRYPRLYIPGQSNTLFNVKSFIVKLFHGVFTSLALYFILYGIYHDRVSSTGKPESIYDELSVAIGAILVIIVNLQMAFDTCHWTWINHFFIWGSIVFYFLYTFATYSSVAFNKLPSTFPSVGAAENTFGSGVFWAALLLTSIVCILPVLGYRWCKQKLYPTFTEYVRRGLWKESRPKRHLRGKHHSSRSRPPSTRSGFAFSQRARLGEMIMSGKWLPKIKTKSKQSFDLPQISKDI
ncbi:phospholipid-transporting ATPase ID isoform X3 [Hydra vulgaris]|uniref:Phospholipid-transporting ATPase n=1 Tax=Hydra vulgaris TaxID=6087 RepID=A0ABM4DE53_HYDVU